MNLQERSTTVTTTNVVPYNNRAKNENMVGTTSLVLLGLLGLIYTFHMIFMQWGIIQYDKVFLRVNAYTSVYYIPSIILPMIYFVMKPKCLKTALELFN